MEFIEEASLAIARINNHGKTKNVNSQMNSMRNVTVASGKKQAKQFASWQTIQRMEDQKEEPKIEVNNSVKRTAWRCPFMGDQGEIALICECEIISIFTFIVRPFDLDHPNFSGAFTPNKNDKDQKGKSAGGI